METNIVIRLLIVLNDQSPYEKIDFIPLTQLQKNVSKNYTTGERKVF